MAEPLKYADQATINVNELRPHFAVSCCAVITLSPSESTYQESAPSRLSCSSMSIPCGLGTAAGGLFVSNPLSSSWRTGRIVVGKQASLQCQHPSGLTSKAEAPLRDKGSTRRLAHKALSIATLVIAVCVFSV